MNIIMAERKDIMENETYNRLCIITINDICKATFYEKDKYATSAEIIYMPCHYTPFKNKKEGQTNIKYVLFKDYGDYYRDYITNHIVAKGMPESTPLYMWGTEAVFMESADVAAGAPLCVPNNAKTITYSEEEADEFVRENPSYALEFNRLYASGLNAINDCNNHIITGGRQKSFKRRNG